MKYADLTPEQKKRRNQSNAASRNRYEAAAYEKACLRVRKDGGDGVTLEQVRQAAEADGLSLNAWIIRAIKGKL